MKCNFIDEDKYNMFITMNMIIGDLQAISVLGYPNLLLILMSMADEW